jgi:hypothetical protein
MGNVLRPVEGMGAISLDHFEIHVPSLVGNYTLSPHFSNTHYSIHYIALAALILTCLTMVRA